MRKPLVVLALGLVFLLPALSQAGNLTVRGGAFFPRANTGSTDPNDFDLFADASDLYTRNPSALDADGRPPGLEQSDWIGFTGGVEYNIGLARFVEIGFSVDGYGRSLDTTYRDYTRPSGDEIRQTLKLSVVPFGVSVRFGPTGRKAKVAPYVAVGADLVVYSYEAFGDFVDFFDPDQPILADSFRSDGVAPGFHVAGGVRVPLGRDFSLIAEYRYQWAEASMGNDFFQNRIDLSGGSATLGFNIRF